jgi:tight adherence protein C
MLFRDKEILKDRLDGVKKLSGDNAKEDELKQPFIQRVIRPGYQRLVKAIGNITPKAIRDKYDILIKTSGSSKKVTVNGILMFQIMLGLVQGGSAYLLMKAVSTEISWGRVFLSFLLGFLLPLMHIYTKAEKRKEKIRKSLPDLLDLVYVSVEAGLGFDAALKKSAEKMKGPLSTELIKALNEISKGKEREEAFKDMVSRTGVDEVSTFIRAVIQTEKLGSNIANMLRVQSATMRQMRRQRAEEKAAKLPIKMLFPLMFLMFPALFVVILGPAVINIMNSLGNM